MTIMDSVSSSLQQNKMEEQKHTQMQLLVLQLMIF